MLTKSNLPLVSETRLTQLPPAEFNSCNVFNSYNSVFDMGWLGLGYFQKTLVCVSCFMKSMLVYADQKYNCRDNYGSLGSETRLTQLPPAEFKSCNVFNSCDGVFEMEWLVNC